MLIGELAAVTGVAARTLRFWEDEGLLPDPARTPGGYRDYEAATVDRVTFVRRAQAAGLTLAQIRTVLEVREDGRAPCEHVERFVAARLAEVDARLAELQRTRDSLARLGERLDDLDPADCAGPTVCQAIDDAQRPPSPSR